MLCHYDGSVACCLSSITGFQMLSVKPKFKAVWELTSSKDVAWQRHISNMKLMPFPPPAATVLHAHGKAATLCIIAHRE